MGLLPDKSLTTLPIYNDRCHRSHYSVDASGYSVWPDSVGVPRDSDELVRLVRYCIRRGVPIIPRGGGTGLVGGALGRGMVFDMTQMAQMSMEGDVVNVSSGVFLGALNKFLARYGQMIGPNPSVGPYCTVGGMVATNAAGSRSLKYGALIDNLVGVTIVDGHGDVVDLPEDVPYGGRIFDICRMADVSTYPRTTKNSCGYRMDAVRNGAEAHRIIPASEGTLGVVVSARLRTYPVPVRRHLVRITYDSSSDAAADVPTIMGYEPESLEMMGPMTPVSSGPVLLAGFDTDTPLQSLRHDMAGRKLDVLSDSEAIWWSDMRNGALSAALRGGATAGMVEDAAVPISHLPDLLAAIEELRPPDGHLAYFGHAGNGNIHVRLTKQPSDEASEAYLARVIELGGTITGEHGDGLVRTSMVRQQYGDTNYGLFKELKMLFDPYNIMNPGKIVP